MKYHIWTEGCQMNVADSQRVATALEQLGFEYSEKIEAADVIVLNTCVVRQSAEDKAYGRLTTLRPLKVKNPKLVINLMGCLVGVKNNAKLKERFPYVDVFSPPSDPGPLLAFLTQEESHFLDQAETEKRFAIQDGKAQPDTRRQNVVGYISIVYGCSHACTYCVIPYRRGVERSRPAAEVLEEARGMVAQGVKEITLLGQIVDRYGKDLAEGSTLTGLLRQMNEIEGLQRLRFLTSHPNWMTDELLDCVNELPKVCPHIEVPAQAGDDQVLENMKRGYTSADYYRLVEKIRRKIPGVSIATDIIVGFPGETEEQFQHSVDLLTDLKLDVAHLARYSPRPDTVATRRMADDVPPAEKMRRFRLLEHLQAGITAEINSRYLGTKVAVLFEDKVKGRWRGRTPTTRLVFVESSEDLRGQEREVLITWTGPWSMQGRLD
jgi:tRNA-2-methylthio-N6-dimethylallyladenosine synthase